MLSYSFILIIESYVLNRLQKKYFYIKKRFDNLCQTSFYKRKLMLIKFIHVLVFYVSIGKIENMSNPNN